MQKIIIKKLDGTLIHKSEYTQSMIDSGWLQSNIDSGAFGKPEQWLSEKELISIGLSIEGRESQEEQMHEAIYSVYKVDCEYTYEIVNLDEDYDYLLQVCLDNRIKNYPSSNDYLDGIVKGDQLQCQKYIDDCLAVKKKFPKPVKK